jgi:predicted amidohydrolase
MQLFLFSILILICSVISYGMASPSAVVSYIAAAIQWNPLGNITLPPRDYIALNIDAWEEWIKKASLSGAEVVIFPEGALGMFNAEDMGNTRELLFPYCVPLGIVGKSNPCMEHPGTPIPPSSEYYQIWRASCMAREHGVYLALNLCEVQPCTNSTNNDDAPVNTDVQQPPCPSDSHFQWNTEVIFDPSGTLVLKYHKAHLFGGSGIFDQALPVPSAFNASFDSNGINSESSLVEFGSFVCFDIQFIHPALDVIAPYSTGGLGAKNVLFSSWWVNSAPSFNAVMLQQSWSRQNGVNLIAANIGAGSQSAGGGIYSKGEPINTAWNASDYTGTTVMVIAKLSSDASVTAEPHQLVFDDSPIDDIGAGQDIPEVNISYSQLPSSLCFPNAVTPALANCTLFTSGALREIAETLGINWENESAVKFNLPLSENNALQCSISFTVVTDSITDSNAHEAWASITFDKIETFPYSPDPLHLQVCSLQHCDTILSHGTACEANFQSYRTRFNTFQMIFDGVDPTAHIAPMIGFTDGQVSSTKFAAFTDSNQTQNKRQTKQHHHHHHPHTSTTPTTTADDTSIRHLTWTSTAAFNDESLYSTLIFAIVPDPSTM